LWRRYNSTVLKKFEACRALGISPLRGSSSKIILDDLAAAAAAVAAALAVVDESVGCEPSSEIVASLVSFLKKANQNSILSLVFLN